MAVWSWKVRQGKDNPQTTMEVRATVETEVGAKLSLAREVETASMALGHIMVLEARGVA